MGGFVRIGNRQHFERSDIGPIFQGTGEKTDDYGYEFLKECGKNPWAIALAFKKMKEFSKKGDGKYDILLRAFSTHPDFEERIERIRKKAVSDGYSIK